MAAVSNVISLGIGTPSSIPMFLTLGLGLGSVYNPDRIDMTLMTVAPATLSTSSIAPASTASTLS